MIIDDQPTIMSGGINLNYFVDVMALWLKK